MRRARARAYASQAPRHAPIPPPPPPTHPHPSRPRRLARPSSPLAPAYQQHYPFENKEAFEGSFPADFIAEGIDQTRGWFYTLMVLSTALFDKPAWKNLICNGLVLAEDGRKMSKRLKNYPAPSLILERYGADALRLYLINSPVVHAEDLRFKEDGVKQVLKDVFLPWYHAYRLFVQGASSLEGSQGARPLRATRPRRSRRRTRWTGGSSPRRTTCSSSCAPRWRRTACTRSSRSSSC